MFREINKLESFLFSIEAANFNREDETFKELQEVFDLFVVVIFRIFCKVYKLLSECSCLVRFSSFFYIWFVFVVFCYFSTAIFINLYFLKNIYDRKYILDLVIKHRPFSLNFFRVFFHSSAVKFSE